MPNIKSAIKRVKVIEKKTLENKMVKSRLSTFVKKFKSAVSENKLEEAEVLFSEVVSLLDRAAKDNIIHKNNASKKQAHLAELLHKAKSVK